MGKFLSGKMQGKNSYRGDFFIGLCAVDEFFGYMTYKVPGEISHKNT